MIPGDAYPQSSSQASNTCRIGLVLCYQFFIWNCVISNFAFLKETRNLFKRWPLNLWWISNKTIMEVRKYYKSCYFQKFPSPRLLKHIVTLFATVVFNIFMRQTLTDDFWRLYKNKNCAFSLSIWKIRNTLNIIVQAIHT